MGTAKLVAFVFDHVVDVLVVLGNFLLAATTVLITANVFLRYFFRDLAQGWIIEITPWLIAYTVFFSASRLLQNGGHVNVDFWISRQSRKTKAWMGFVTSVIAAIMCAIVTWIGMVVTLDNFSKGVLTAESVRIPKFVVLIFIPLGFFLLFAEFLRTSRKFLTSRRDH